MDHNPIQRCYFAISLYESCTFHVDEVFIKLERGDFLVFDDESHVSFHKKDNFHFIFFHATGRGSYVYCRRENSNCHDEDGTDLSHMSPRVLSTNTESVAPTVVTAPPGALVQKLDEDNASKWIQKTTIMAFYLRENLSLPSSKCGSELRMKCEGGIGDVLIIHANGCIEAIISASAFQTYFSYLTTDESEKGVVTIAMDDNMDRLQDQHHVEVKRRYPVLAKQMNTCFAACCGHRTPLTVGQKGDFLVQAEQEQIAVGTMRYSFISAGHCGFLDQTSGIGAVTDADECSDMMHMQWTLTPKLMEALFIRVEDEKDKGNTFPGSEECTDKNTTEYSLLPTDAFLPHYECWKGVIHKRTKITRQWKASLAILYPNRIVLGKAVALKEGKEVPAGIMTDTQTIFLANCSIYPSCIDNKEILFVHNAKINDPVDTQKSFQPYSAVKKTPATRGQRLSNFISKKSVKAATADRGEMVSNVNGVYLSSPTLSLTVLSTLLNSAILYSRRNLALLATKAGNCDRVIEILLSVSPHDAVTILTTLCPVDASPGMMIQHVAAKASIELMKVLFPAHVQTQPGLPTAITRDLNILAFSSSGFTCLHYAVIADGLNVVKFLLKNDVYKLSENTPTRDGKTPLHLAKSATITNYLVDNGASLDTEDDDGNTPLMSLIVFGSYDAVAAFLKYHVTSGEGVTSYDINAKSWKTGLSALSLAIRTFNDRTIEIVQRLLEKGADPNSADLKRNSCLHEAASLFNTLAKGFAVDEESMKMDMVKCWELVRVLVEAGADTTLENDSGLTPFLLICHAEFFPGTSEAVKIVDLLTVASQADSSGGEERNLVVNCRTSDGSFPLHIIVQSCNVELLECLIRKGANVNSKDINGNTPLDLVHSAQDLISPSTSLRDAERMMRCMGILTNNKALRRLRKHIPMEGDQPTIKFASSSTHVGLYEVKSATLKAIIDRLCDEMLYNDADAEALVFSFEEDERASCGDILGMIYSNYPSVCDVNAPDEEIGVSLMTVNECSGNGDSVVHKSMDKSQLTARQSSYFASESFVNRKSGNGSAFSDARNNSPGGLILLLRVWFDLNSKSIGNERFVEILRVLAVQLLKDFPHDLSMRTKRIFYSFDDECDVQSLVDGFMCIVPETIMSSRMLSRKKLSGSQATKSTENQRLEDLLISFAQPNWSVKALKLQGVENFAKFQLRKYSPLHIAQQASSMQHYLQQRVREDELLSLKYSDVGLCPNICVLRDWNDNVANNFISEILSGSTPKNRSEVICHILEIAFQALEVMNNFELVVIILGVLECTAIYRLKLTWACVESKQPGRRSKLKRIVGIAGRNVRSLMQSADTPLVPFLGVYLQQMINLHEMPSKYKFDNCDNDHINLSKFRNILKVLHEHRKNQATYFKLQVKDDIQKCLQKPAALCSEDGFLRRSIELEPYK